ncbi:hypothetical protein AVEN_100846-1 [Araneus ventricosus]|uniref:Uncharacterized protein n=1 Tax=Araneus ventricosus TaxID=182803 RepID=A0A4Y2AV93_ARAVE|nr:hypothetical protein AVEN_100846-1 [Araneus ventricosus]
MAMTWRKILQNSPKCRDIDTTSSLELFNHIFDCYNTWTGCLQLELGRKFPLSRNRAVIARTASLDDRYKLRNAVFRHFQRKMNNNNKSAHAQKKIPTCPAFDAKF